MRPEAENRISVIYRLSCRLQQIVKKVDVLALTDDEGMRTWLPLVDRQGSSVGPFSAINKSCLSLQSTPSVIESHAAVRTLKLVPFAKIEIVPQA